MEILFENEIAIVACMKNESPYIEEWLEYHYQIGIDKFYLYDNDSEDRAELQKILQPWIDSKIVDLIELPGDYAQLPGYNDAILKHRFDCRYLAFIDIDEFIVPKQDRDLIETIDSIFATEVDPLARIGGLGINWRCFGSNGQDRKIEGGVLERFVKRSPDDFERNFVIKTISNPRRVQEIHRAHDATYFTNCICVNENGKKIAEFENRENTVAKLQINHYFTKSREEFEQKRSRGRADCYLRYNDTTFDYYQRDEVEDLTALEIFNKPSFRREIYRDDESTIRDLKSMLAEKSENLERILTCFHRARSLNDRSRREEFTNRSLEQLVQIHKQPDHMSESYLLFDTIPEILAAKTKFSPYVLNITNQILNYLESTMRQNLYWIEMMNLRRRRELIQSFL